MGTTAHKQGRIAGANAVGGQAQFAGSLGTQVVKVFTLAAAGTGLREIPARRADFDALATELVVPDRKVYYPGAHMLRIRVIGDRATRRLLGAQILGHLLRSDLRGQELVERLGQPQNAVSYHLKTLRTLGLLRNRRSSGDARDIYYSVDLPTLQALYAAVGDAFQLREPGSARTDQRRPGSTTPLRILYVCTQNSARSQLAEALTRQRGGEQVEVASAGTTPTVVHPLTQALLAEHGIDPTRYVAKALDHFIGRPFDRIVTVCDRARDQCPAFSEDSVAIHWSIADPVAPPNPADRQAAFLDVWQDLGVRIDHLLRLPVPDDGPRVLSPAMLAPVAQ